MRRVQVKFRWFERYKSGVLLRLQHRTTSTPLTSYVQGPDPTKHLLVGANAATILTLCGCQLSLETWTTHDPVLLCVHQWTYFTHRGVYRAQLMWLFACTESGTWHKTYTLLIALRKEVLTRGETQPRLVFSLQHEHVILVFSSHLLNHSKHSQLCPFSIQLHVVLHLNRFNFAATNLRNRLLKY